MRSSTLARRCSSQAAGAAGHLLQQRIDLHALIQRRAAGLQGQVAIDIGTRLEGPRRRIEGHSLVAEHAQVGQHEFRPVLVEVAEEHQPKALAQRAHHHAPGGFAGCDTLGLPLRIGPGRLVQGLQGLQKLGLAQA